MTYYRDKEGRALELMEWARLYEDDDYRLVADTQLDGGVIVRTMWEGLDAKVVGAGDMFHTGVCQNDCWETVWAGNHPCTVAEAKAAHELFVAKVRELPAVTTRIP